VLELASGTGEHITHFARALPDLNWQPSDPSPIARQSIAAWVAAQALGNVAPPLELDAAARIG
jgi:tRNA G46 methylase TrmB